MTHLHYKGVRLPRPLLLELLAGKPLLVLEAHEAL